MPTTLASGEWAGRIQNALIGALAAMGPARPPARSRGGPTWPTTCCGGATGRSTIDNPDNAQFISFASLTRMGHYRCRGWVCGNPGNYFRATPSWNVMPDERQVRAYEAEADWHGSRGPRGGRLGGKPGG